MAAKKPVEKHTPTREEIDAADRVIRKVTGVGDGAGKMHSLPLVSSVFKTSVAMHEAIETLEKAYQRKVESEHALKGTVDAETGNHQPGLEELKEELIGVVVGAEVPGYRYGSLAVAVNLSPGRKTLSPDLLRDKMLEIGIAPEEVGRVIAESYKTGSDFYTVKIEKLT